jgi:uncharacterized cupredoxin-like copper-binding protein
MRTRLAQLVAVGVAAAAAACSAPSAAPPSSSSPATGPEAGAPREQVVAVTLADFSITPKTMTVAPGRVRFEVINQGVIEHDFHIPALERGHGHEQQLLKPGERKVFTYDAGSGTYEVVCTIPGHREAGMLATLAAGS